MSFSRNGWLALLALTAWAQDPVSVFVADDPSTCFSISGTASSNLRVVSVENQPFSRALRLRTPAAGANPWSMQARCAGTKPARQADTLVASFWIRLVDAPEGYGLTTFILEKNKDPYTKSADYTVLGTAEWRKVEFPFYLKENYSTGGSGGDGFAVGFFLGHMAQEIEIGGISVASYGNNIPLKDLNLKDWPYAGRGPEAAWRNAANERIEKLRKGDIAVEVVDADGRPVANAGVKIRMKRHAFGFGTAVNAALLNRNSADGQKYREALPKLFNKAVIENHLKWPFFESWGRADAAFALDWLPANGIKDVRGHNIIWPGKRNLPADVVKMLETNPVDKVALRARIDGRISEAVNFTKGKVTEWDVINEPFDNKDVQAVLGDEEMAVWFKTAREIDPDVKLHINDYDNIEDGGLNLKHIDHYLKTIQMLIDQGAPVDGIGLQCHFNSNFTSPERALELLDRFAKFEKDLLVTEFDINIKDDDTQAEYTRDFLTVCFSHPAMKAFLMWGFWAGAHWLPDGAMIRQDWSTKPNYDVWMDLVYKQWWTNAEGVTGEDGVFRTRGFLGDYEAEVTVGGDTRTLPLSAKSNREVNLLRVAP